VQSTSHVESGGQTTPVSWHDDTPPHETWHRMPAGQVIVEALHAPVAVQSTMQRSSLQPPVHPAGHVCGAEELPAGQVTPAVPPSKPATAQFAVQEELTQRWPGSQAWPQLPQF